MVCRIILPNIHHTYHPDRNDERVILSCWVEQPIVFVLTIIAGFIVCVILYYILIKFTPLNWLINGYSKSPLKIKVGGR